LNILKTLRQPGIQDNDGSQQNNDEVSFVPTHDSETTAANTNASVNSS